MDYRKILMNNLLSDTNIQHIVGLIMKDFTIGSSAGTKCKKIIIGNINNILRGLTTYPQNNDDLIETIGNINKTCYDDFATYLVNKYPNKNIHRNNQEFMHTDPSPGQPQGMIIITEDEKNKLLEQYELPGKKNNISADAFLEYLTNPSVLQMFQMMINQLNQTNSPINNISRSNVDTILTEDDVRKLLQNNSVKKHNETKSKKTKTVKTQPTTLIKNVKTAKDESAPRVKLVNQIKSTYSDESDNNTEYETDSGTQNESDNEYINEYFNEPDNQIENSITSESEDEDDAETEIETDNKIDLSKGMTTDLLLKIEQRIKEIMVLKNKYLNEENENTDELINELDGEKKQLIAAVYEFKKNSDKMAKRNKSQVEKLSIMCSNREDDTDDNIEYLDLKFDPTNDYNDLKNIIIKIKSENKISDISLVDYYLPFNENNVTRFNGEFSIFFEEKTFRIIIPPSKYTIHTLLNYISSQINFLEFNIDESKFISIKNNMGMKFDLMTGDNTIFPLLGFTNKANSYKNKTAYTGATKYDTESNEKVFFVLSGTSMEPLEMEFDKKVMSDTTLKKTKSGFNIKQLMLRFTTVLHQCYDFIMPFNMCIRITYIKQN